jgi:hypothetical protein
MKQRNMHLVTHLFTITLCLPFSAIYRSPSADFEPCLGFMETLPDFQSQQCRFGHFLITLSADVRKKERE